MTMRSKLSTQVLAPWRRLRLASKLNLTLAALGALGFGIGGLALNSAIRPAFEGLERASVDLQIGRANALLASTLEGIESATRDYAVWDDSYDYVITKDPGFEQETLTTLALVNVSVNASAYARLSGDLLAARYVDKEAEADAPSLGESFGRLATSEPVLALARRGPSFSIFMVFEGRILAIDGAQIVRSDGTGEPAGFVLMAREFGDAAASAALQTAVKVTSTAPTVTLASTKDAWRVAVPIATTDGAAIGAMAFETPRDVSRLGAATILNALLTSALIMAAALIGVFVIMRAVVVSRLATFNAHMQNVAANGGLSPLRDDGSRDEIGSLGRSFNAMLGELKELREQLEMQFFQLGQSESAAGAMHNVRNSLNPVSVIISQALTEQPAVRPQDIERALKELTSSEADDARRERLTAFLRATIDDAERRANARRENLLTARTSLAEALEILRTQHDIGHQEIPVERFDVLEVIRRNAALARFAPWGEVELALPAEGAMVCANRLLLSQVIGNLLTNAVEAIVAADRRPGRLTIALTRAEAGQNAIVSIAISDDGQGFDPHAARKLFERGYSSKNARSSGLGLHWCANTIQKMGGSLSLNSEGPGMGAQAIIRLPEKSGAAPVYADERVRAA